MTLRSVHVCIALFLMACGLTFGQEPETAEGASTTETFDWNLAGRIAVQHGGRVKPLDTFARDLVKSTYGRDRFEGQHPVETYFRWMADGERWADEPLVYLVKSDLRTDIGLSDADGNRFAASELQHNMKLLEIMREGHTAELAGEKPTFKQTKAGEVLGRVHTLLSVFNHEMPLMAPPQDGDPLATWKSMPDLMTVSDADPHGSSDNSAIGEQEAALSLAFAGMYHSISDGRADIFNSSAQLFIDAQTSILVSYPEVTDKLAWEVAYNGLEPFSWARVVLLLAFALYLISLKPKLSSLKSAGLGLVILGILFYTTGIIMRWHIGGRAPWSNMYESLLTIGWSVVLIAVTFELVKRERIFGMAGSLMGALTLGIAAYASLDRGINPLVPALQSYWLTYHVIIILAGYACCALAMIIGHGVLIGAIRSRGQLTPGVKRLTQANLRIIQLGSVLLILGILLGAVWANVSWGRFWGWDPKETWSLVTWFAYIVLLHGRSAGWLRWRGLAVASVAAFPIVVMTYYGVNFYLSGLHSYGAGSAPGIPWEAWAYLGIEAVFLTWAISSLNSMVPRGPKSAAPTRAQAQTAAREPQLEEA